MNECFFCETALEPANDAEIEGVDVCVDCCDAVNTVVLDYLVSSPGGQDLLVDIIEDELSNPEGRLRQALKDIVKEVISEE